MNKFTCITIAIGEKYKHEANRLKLSFPDLHIFTKHNPLYKPFGNSDLFDALCHKSNFAAYLPENVTGPIFLMDADLYSDIENPLERFTIEPDVDFAFVPYSGMWFFPDTPRQNAINILNGKINSGFLYFKNIDIARDISAQWCEMCHKRMSLSLWEYDEYSLMIIIANSEYKWKHLDGIWNDWGENNGFDPNPNSILKQKHI